MIQEDIPAGFQLHITTWENDGDAYSTQIISGLTEEDTWFYIDMAKKFISRNGWKADVGMGNGSTSLGQQIGLVEGLLERHPNISEETRKKWSNALESDKGIEDVDWDDEESDHDGHIYDYLCELVLGTPVDEYYRYDEHSFCRVFEGFNVYYIPETAKEVTHLFKDPEAPRPVGSFAKLVETELGIHKTV